MKSFDNFITLWKENKDIEALVQAGASIPSPEDVLMHLSKLDQTEREDVLKSLSEATIALQNYAEQTAAEARILKNEIQQSHQRSRACLTYVSSQFKNDTIKRK